MINSHTENKCLSTFFPNQSVPSYLYSCKAYILFYWHRPIRCEASRQSVVLIKDKIRSLTVKQMCLFLELLLLI